MPITPTDIDSAVPVAGTPSRALTNAALKGLITDIAAVGVGVGIGTAADFAALPAPATVSGQRWWVLASTGVWMVNRKTKGAYYSDGAAWSYLGDFPVTAAEVGFTPGSGIAATNTQAAIEEVVSDTAALLANKAASGAATASGLTMATSRLLGRNTAAAGALEEIILGTNLSMTGTTLNAAASAPGGTATQVQYNLAGAFAGAANVLIEGGELRLPAIATPAAPAAGGVKLFGAALAGRTLPAFIGPTGLTNYLQPHFSQNRVGLISAIANAATFSTVGMSTFTVTGTATAAGVGVTNLHQSMRRVEALVTVAAATAVAGVRAGSAQFQRGNAAGVGGFTLVMVWGPATGPSTAGTFRMFAGLGPNAAPTDVDPSTLTGIIGMGCDAADTQIQIITNDNTGAGTKTALGASFPKPTLDRTEVYELSLFCAPNGTEIFYRVERRQTGAVATGSVTVDLPLATVASIPLAYCSVGGTSSVVGLAMMQLYTEVQN